MQTSLRLLRFLALVNIGFALGSSDQEAVVRLQSIVPTPEMNGQPAEELAAGAPKPPSNWTTMAEALDIFNPRHLAKNWADGRRLQAIDPQCDRDVTRYLEGLRRQELWALKMDDATGRYTNGFYWGNSYFVGSAVECEYIGQAGAENGPPEDADRISEAAEFNAEPHKKRANDGFSASANYHQQVALDSRPPYPLGFFVMRIALNGSLSPLPRIVHLGACLPFSCHAADVELITKLAASDRAGRYMQIEKVRDQHNYYDVYSDPIFWLLFIVSAATLFLLIVGTSYDLYLRKRIKRKQHLAYDLEKHVKLEQLAAAKMHNVIEPVVAGNGPANAGIVNNNNDHEGSLRTPTPDLLKLNVLQELVLSFSVRTNLAVICEDEVGRNTISTVHGLRALSMAWVILGHTCIVVFKYSDNMEYRKVVEKKFLFQTIQNGAFSVDTFFFMSGLLVSYLYFRTNAKGDLSRLTQGTQGFLEGLLKFLGLLAYRFCRLTTPYLYVLGLTAVSMQWFYSNSVFEPPTNDHDNCRQYWWRNLLYINTLFPAEQMCMLWSWYVADDTQFYIVGAVILIIGTKHFKLAASIMAVLMLSAWLTTGYIALVNNHIPNTDDPLALFDKIYDKPWTRLGPYLIGMAVGYFLFKTDRQIKMSKATVFLGWLFSTACLLCLLFGLYETELSPAVGAAYSSLSHSVWALSLAWIVIACSTGYGGYVNSLLSAPILYPFSRVTYCAYLVHPIIIRMTAMNMDSPLHLSKDSMFITYLGQVVASYILSFVISLAFEAPAVSMLKILSPNKRKLIK